MSKKLNVLQAYNAMFHFLEIYYNRTESDDIGALLGSMSLLDDGKPADIAIWKDWNESICACDVQNYLELDNSMNHSDEY